MPLLINNEVTGAYLRPRNLYWNTQKVAMSTSPQSVSHVSQPTFKHPGVTFASCT